MRKFNRNSIVVAIAVSFILGLAGPLTALAATTPTLGTAATFGVLSDTFTSPIGPTTVNGDVGYTTPPVVPAIVTGSIFTAISGIPAGAVYTQAGIDQATALSSLNLQSCDFTFAPGTIDLAADTTHIPTHGSILGEYYPGVYCTSGVASAFSVGTAGITLTGAGTYIFRDDGALDTVTNSSVVLNGASACDVFWTPNGATTLNHDSSFVGTVIPILAAAHDITIYDAVTWIGRALTYGHTITTPNTNVTITVPTCTAPLLTLTKVVSGGTKVVSDFHLFIDGVGVTSGVANTVLAGLHTVSETSDIDYTSVIDGDCATNGTINLASGTVKTCTITNTYIPVHGSGGGASVTYGCKDQLASNYNYFSVSQPFLCTYAATTTIAVMNTAATTTFAVMTTTATTTTPGFPNTGLPPRDEHAPWYTVIFLLLLDLRLF